MNKSWEENEERENMKRETKGWKKWAPHLIPLGIYGSKTELEDF